MFLRAGLLSLVLLLASRILGLLRESAQAAAFGATGMGDLAVLMFSLPDWITGVVAGGALSYALLPQWAQASAAQVGASQRRMGRLLLAGGVAAALLLAALHAPLARLLLPGVPPALSGHAGQALMWSAAALPLALVAALSTTRLQHERDFVGMYASNLVVNGLLIATLLVAGWTLTDVAAAGSVAWLGIGLLAAMGARVAWLAWRQRPFAAAADDAHPGFLPPVPLWIWAALSAGLPLALPFVARSLASHTGEGGLATFNYAWKLVELPLMLAIQLVATLALPAISRAMAEGGASGTAARMAVRSGFALAWVLACAACAGLTLAAPAVAQLLFGWGRMQADALAQVATWGRVGGWSLLPQALVAIATAVLAARSRMAPVAASYALALVLLLAAGWAGTTGGAELMLALDGLLCVVAAGCLFALRDHLMEWLPWRAIAVSGLALLACQALRMGPWLDALAVPVQLLVGTACAALVAGTAFGASGDLRRALRR